MIEEKHKFRRGQIVRAVETLTSGGRPYIENGKEYVVIEKGRGRWAYIKVLGTDNVGHDVHQDVFAVR